jgi:hypothetical protein
MLPSVANDAKRNQVPRFVMTKLTARLHMVDV